MKMTKQEKQRKAEDYSVLILNVLMQVFEKDSSMMHIDIEEFKNPDNLRCFIHAIANLLPNSVYCSLTRNEADSLEFNYLANRLCFEFATMESENKG
jgi:hypothetical protein